MTLRVGLLLIVAIALVIFTLQNLAPALPLTVFGIRTPAYPLAVWLTGAILAGALTTLMLAAVAHLLPLPNQRGKRSQRRPRTMGRDRPWPPYGDDAPRPPRETYRSTNFDADESAPSARYGTSRKPFYGDSDVQDWGSFRPRETWEDWEQRPDPNSPTPASVRDQRQAEKERQRKRKDPRYAANESVEEIAQGWDNWDDRSYQPRGASPIDDALADIEEGWEDYGDDYGIYDDDPQQSSDHRVEYEYADVPPPKTVYQDGTIYSSRPQDGANSDARDYVEQSYGGDADDYANPQDNEDYGNDYDYDYDSIAEDRDDPVFGEGGLDSGDDETEAGVYDADYRVIIPPYHPLDDDDSRDQRDRT